MKQGALLETLETILVVTVITVLIWLYAEGETINPESKKIKVRFVPPTAGLVVTLPGQPSTEFGVAATTVTATIQASRGDWPKIHEWVRKETIDIEVKVPVTDTEDQLINLREALNQSALADVNAFVKETDPATVTVRVRQLQEVPMGISIDRGELELSDFEPTFTPDTVTVTMPAEAAQLVRSQNLKLVARLDLLDPDSLAEDTQNIESVELNLPAELQPYAPITKLAQNKTDVTFVVRKYTETYELPAVQVRLSISDDITGLYRIRFEPESQRFLRVTVRGPADTIRRIKEDTNSSLVRASVLIKMADLGPDGNQAAPLEIFVPEGVQVIAKEPNLTTITYVATPLNDQP